MSDPYKPPSTVVADKVTLADEDFVQFVGDGGYNEKWKTFKATNAWMFGFHWPVFLVGPLWCVYRKMYVFGAILFLGGLLVSFIFEVAIELLELPSSELFIRVGRLIAIFLVLRIPAALIANPLYCRKAAKAISAAPSGPAEARAQYLERRGGTTQYAVWLLLLLYVVLRIADALVARSIS